MRSAILIINGFTTKLSRLYFFFSSPATIVSFLQHFVSLCSFFSPSGHLSLPMWSELSESLESFNRKVLWIKGIKMFRYRKYRREEGQRWWDWREAINSKKSNIQPVPLPFCFPLFPVPKHSELEVPVPGPFQHLWLDICARVPGHYVVQWI